VEFTLAYHNLFCHVPGCASTLLAGSQADTHTCMGEEKAFSFNYLDSQARKRGSVGATNCQIHYHGRF